MNSFPLFRKRQKVFQETLPKLTFLTKFPDMTAVKTAVISGKLLSSDNNHFITQDIILLSKIEKKLFDSKYYLITVRKQRADFTISFFACAYN